MTTLARESDVAARKTLEVLWIAFMDPTITWKEECVTVIQELALFADLCGLYPVGPQPERR